MKKLNIELRGKAEKQWEWMKEDLGIEDDEKLLLQILSLFLKITKKTQGGKEPIVFRR